MGRRGPRATPTETLRKRGSPLAARNKKRGEPKAPVVDGVPACPARLTGDARKIWAAVAAELVTMKVLASGDLNTLERYCETLADYWRARKQIAIVNKQMKIFDSDVERANQIILRDYNNILTKLEQEFGLTPSARTRVSEAPKRDKPAPEAKPKAGAPKAAFADRTFSIVEAS